MSIEVFISHAHKDKLIADFIIQFLMDGTGLSQREIRSTSNTATGLKTGTTLTSALRRDIKSCRVFMPLITMNTASSEFVAFEIGGAWALGQKITPLVYEYNGMNFQIPSVLKELIYCNLLDIGAVDNLAYDVATTIFDKRDIPLPNARLLAARTLVEQVKTLVWTPRASK